MVPIDDQPSDDSPLPHPTVPGIIWRTFRFVLRIVFVVWFRYRARGFEKIPATGGGLMLMNHQSFLDPLLAGAPLSRPVSYVARDTLFRIPIFGRLFKYTYVIPINRRSAGGSIVRESVRRIRHGFLVGFFPEGTRSSDGSVGPLKPGFVAIVRRSDGPIYPVGIAGAHEAWPRKAWFPRPRRVCVVFGDPLTREEIDRYTTRGSEEQLVALVRDRIVACQREAEHWRRS